MHQESAHRMMAKSAILVATTVDAFGETNVVWVPALIGELGRILKHEDRSIRCCIPRLGRLDVARQDVSFLNLWVGKEPVGGFGACPVLAGQRNCASHSIAQAAEQLAEPAPETGIFERCLINLATRPVITPGKQFL